MAKLNDLRRGRTIWVDHFGTHPAVVIIEGDRSVVVLCGTSKQKSDPDEVCIQPQSPAGYSLGLSAPTYFYWWKVAIVSSEAAIKSVKGPCPPAVFHALEKLAVIAANKTQEKAIRAALVGAVAQVTGSEVAQAAPVEAVALKAKSGGGSETA